MKHRLFGTLLAATTVALCLAMPGVAAAQAYPVKPVRMIVTFAAGGGADFVARAIAPKLIDMGMEPSLLSPADFRAFIQRDIAMWTEVVKASGVTLY